jgi:cyclophilin family peptidyl-prolyl cis-trans isomerase/HEAT repeat protein
VSRPKTARELPRNPLSKYAAAPVTRWLLILCASTAACAVPIKASISPAELMREVRRAEAMRDGDAPAVHRGVGAAQREVRIASLMALARSESTGTSSLALALLGDRDVEVATWAAFALARIAEPTGEAALLSAARGVSVVPEQAVLALGRSGTATIAPALLGFLSDERVKVRAGAALGLGLMAKRLPGALKIEKFLPKLAPLVTDPDRDVRFGAVYALFRISGPQAAVALIPALADADAEIRAHAVRGLAAAKASPNTLDAVVSDPDWRVRAEVAKALGQMAAQLPDEEKAAVTRLLAIIPKEFARFKRDQLSSGRGTHVLLQVIQSASQLGPAGKRVLDALEQAPWTTEGLLPETVPDQARLQCAVAFALDRRDNEVKRVRSCGGPSIAEWRRLQLIARLLAARADANAVEQLANLTSHQDGRVRVAAVESLGEIKNDTSSAALLRLLDSNDPYLSGAAGEILAQPDRNRPASFVNKLRLRLAAIKPDEDPSLLVGLLDAAGALGKDGVILVGELDALLNDKRPALRRRAAAAKAKITGAPSPFLSAEPDQSAPAAKTGNQRVTIKTGRGDVVLALFGDVAPHTNGALTTLIEAGFYDQKTFHRIVPDFVAQGGCPRGDGWGGPGYTILSEGSPLPFVRGAVGIATNGLDTGGSQFFIMHAYHPHLDGQYTLAGRVLEGIEVVDALQEDDQILEVRLDPGVH